MARGGVVSHERGTPVPGVKGGVLVECGVSALRVVVGFFVNETDLDSRQLRAGRVCPASSQTCRAPAPASLKEAQVSLARQEPRTPLQGYLAHQKHPPPRTLKQDNT